MTDTHATQLEYLCPPGRLSINQLAAGFKVNRSTIYRWLAEGVIPRKLVHRDINGRPFFWGFEINIFRMEVDRLVHEEE